MTEYYPLQGLRIHAILIWPWPLSMALEWVMTHLRSPGQPLCQAWASDISSNKKMIADANLHIKYLYMYIKLEKFYEKKTIMACNNFTEQVYKILYLQTDRFGDFNTTIKNLFEGGLIMCFNFYVKVHQYMYMYNAGSCRGSYGYVFTLTLLYFFCRVFTEILRKNSAKIPC